VHKARKEYRKPKWGETQNAGHHPDPSKSKNSSSRAKNKQLLKNITNINSSLKQAQITKLESQK